jgi:hypothetical protein
MTDDHARAVAHTFRALISANGNGSEFAPEHVAESLVAEMDDGPTLRALAAQGIFRLAHLLALPNDGAGLKRHADGLLSSGEIAESRAE